MLHNKSVILLTKLYRRAKIKSYLFFGEYMKKFFVLLSVTCIFVLSLSLFACKKHNNSNTNSTASSIYSQEQGSSSWSNNAWEI